MGFFSDLKEDLNQAVNELIPGEKETAQGTQGNVSGIGQTGMQEQEELMDDEETLKRLAELEDILKNIDLPKKDNPVTSEFGFTGDEVADTMSFEALGEQNLDFGDEVAAAVNAGEADAAESAVAADNVSVADTAVLASENAGVAEAATSATGNAGEAEAAVSASDNAGEADVAAATADNTGVAEAATSATGNAGVADGAISAAGNAGAADVTAGLTQEVAASEQTEAGGPSESTQEGLAISLSESDAEMIQKAGDDLQETVGELKDAVAALKDSVEEQKAKEEAVQESEDQGMESLEDELRATFGAQEGEETVEDYLHEEAIRTGAEIIDKSWVLDLKGMEMMDETAIITAGMRVKGDILSNGSADISGEVIGNVQIKGKLNITGRINGNSKAMEIFADSARVQGDMISDNSVKIGVDSVVIGNIEAASAVIAGAVKGTIDVKGPVILDATAVVLGNVRAKTMQINNGARIEGMCVLCYAEQSAAKFFEEQAGF